MKKGVLILKPDFFDDREHYNLFKSLLKKYKINYAAAFKICNYSKFCKEYRYFDIENTYDKNSAEFYEELRKTSYATIAYDIKYQKEKNFGAAIIFCVDGKEKDKLYENLISIKTDFRKIVQGERSLRDYLVISSENPYLLKEYPTKIDGLEKSLGI